jgi:hypothetical protein
MAILGGSPLGLIGVQSGATNPGPRGRSTFNGGGSRNVNVSSYNSSKGNVYYANDSGNSLFTGKRVVSPSPEVQFLDDGFYDTTGLGSDKYKKTAAMDSDYDTSVLNIVERLANTKAAIKPTDLAFLKYLGVYPNNRMVVVRRFTGPSEDNIFTKSQGGEVGALAMVISWIKEDTDFLTMDFGEEWEEAEASFIGILNSLGEDFGRKSGVGLGDMAGAAGGALPLPGFTEVMTREILAKLGIMNQDDAVLPIGNPNLIKQAKARKTIGYDQAGSGLNTSIAFKIEAEYELKFISGLDPSTVWMDLIGNFTRFGTSKSDTFGLSKSYSQKMKKWINNPSLLIKELSSKLSSAISKAIDLFSKTINDTASDKPVEGSDSPEELAKQKTLSFLNGLKNKLGKFLQKVLQKYRVKAIGIINALSGLPSTPWHVTIGNPIRPFFSAGDMYMENVTLTLGSQLSYNNLPTNLKLEFTLKNARPWGMQEIMAKFNAGYLRSISFTKKMAPSYYETNDVNVNINRPDAGTQSTTTSTVGNTVAGTEPATSVDGGAVSTDTKVENNKVPLKGTKDDKGNLTFQNNEKLVLSNKAKDGKTVYETYTYVKNKDGGYTEYKSTKNKDGKTWTNSAKIIEVGSVEANKLNSLFDKNGNIVSGAQGKVKTIDANSGISSVPSEDVSKVSQDNAKKAASNPVVDKAIVSDNNVKSSNNNTNGFKSRDFVQEKKDNDKKAKDLQNFQNLTFGNSIFTNKKK